MRQRLSGQHAGTEVDVWAIGANIMHCCVEVYPLVDQVVQKNKGHCYTLQAFYPMA